MGLIGIGGTIIATSIATTGMVTVGDEANAPRLARDCDACSFAAN
jgi:hypothetical protein